VEAGRGGSCASHRRQCAAAEVDRGRGGCRTRRRCGRRKAPRRTRRPRQSRDTDAKRHSIEPATTTPPTRREHPEAMFSFSHPLDASLCSTDDVEAHRRESRPACVLAIEPQNCRPAMGQSSWALHAPELAVVVRCSSVNAGRRAVNVFAWNVVRRRATSSHAPGFQVAAPGEHGQSTRALGTAVALAHHRALKAWPLDSRATRVATSVVLELLEQPMFLGLPTPRGEKRRVLSSASTRACLRIC
jgi:hypothetical protein